MSLFIAWPWLALLPGALFAAVYRFTRSRFVALAALVWFAYALYEYSIKRRWTCSGECDIRVDLLLIYPLLVALSVAASIVTLRVLLRRRKAVKMSS